MAKTPQCHCSPARRKRNRRRVLRHRLTICVRRLLLHRSLPDGKSHEPSLTPVAAFGAFLSGFLETSGLALAVFYRSLFSEVPQSCARRNSKDIFPLPPILEWDVGFAATDEQAHLVCSNLCIAALNFLYQGMPKNPSEIRSSRRCSSAQLGVHQHIMQRTARHLRRLADAWEGGFKWTGSFSKYESASSSCYEKVRGDDVDLPSTAATCDPALLAREELWRLVVQPESVFPNACEPSGLVREAPLTGQERQEYLRLTVRELQCGKLRLRHTVKGRARIFAAPKSAEGRQRKIWDGSALSSIAAVPPAPHRLANPSSFLDLLVRPGEKLLLSKRDASTFFDSLKVPKALQEWFGQAPVRVGELLSFGLKLDDIRRWTDDLGEKRLHKHAILFPVNVVWPMGFSWSSCIAQDTSLGCVLEAGVAEDCILSLDHALPKHQDELCAVATDDVMFFHKNHDRGRTTLRRLDRVFAEHGVSKNFKTDVSLSSAMTGLGCDISSFPPLVEPACRKLGGIVLSLCDLLSSRVASPKAVSSLLGVLQWFSLLQRGMFSMFDEVYKFASQPQQQERKPLPEQVLGELVEFLALAPLLPAALDRQFLDTMLACDAAPEFGFGVCAFDCGRRVTEEVGRLAERRGDYVRLLPGPACAEVPRSGTQHRLPFEEQQFRTLISCKARKPAHSGLLECHGVLLTLKWVSRSKARFHSRPVILVDAKVALGCISKGRSSARALRRVLRSTAAVCLACDLLPRLIYIPSESNPADGPSRGHPRRKQM
ncbi:unnamed protein product [Symbiodinium sp. CCMP2456]|nr:unnamed protein product [Symbiodinium sp. CCMP2456]